MNSYVLHLTQEQLNVVAAGLGELPFKIASPVVAEINAQYEAQRAGPAGRAGSVEMRDLQIHNRSVPDLAPDPQ